MNFVLHQFRKVKFPFSFLLLLMGNRKMKKWMKKNDKYQDPNYYPFDERWSYAVKKATNIIKASGTKIEIIGEDNIPKSSSLITPNHVSSADAFILIYVLGKERPSSSVAKIELKNNKIVNGYLKALDSHLLDTIKLRDSLTTLDAVGKWSKDYKRPIIIFPEGERNRRKDNQLNEFKPGAFSIAKKYYLPIFPVTIIGAKKAMNWRTNKDNVVKIIFHKPMKQKDIVNLPTIKISDRVKSKIQKDLDKYSEGKVT